MRLTREGILVLGRSETIEETGELFHAEDKPHGVYRKLNTPGREARLPVFAGTRPRPLALLAGEQRTNPLSYGAAHQYIVSSTGHPVFWQAGITAFSMSRSMRDAI